MLPIGKERGLTKHGWERTCVSNGPRLEPGRLHHHGVDRYRGWNGESARSDENPEMKGLQNEVASSTDEQTESGTSMKRVK